MRCGVCGSVATDQLACTTCDARVALCHLHDVDSTDRLCRCGTAAAWTRGPLAAATMNTRWVQPPPATRRMVNYSDLYDEPASSSSSNNNNSLLSAIATEREVHTTGASSSLSSSVACSTANTVASVEFMHGAGPATGDLTQFVNIAPADAFVGGTIANRDRLGPSPRVIIRFTRQATGRCKLFVDRAATADLYSDTEQAKPGYALVPGPGGLDVDSDDQGVAAVSGAISLTVCGGHRFSLRATDTIGTVASAWALTVRRRVYVQPVCMPFARTQYETFVAEQQQALIARFAAQGIDLVFRDVVQIANQNNVWSGDDRATFRNNIRTACGDAVAPLRPHVITLAFVRHFAEPVECTQLKQSFAPGETDKTFALADKDDPDTPRLAWMPEQLGGPPFRAETAITFKPTEGANFALGSQSLTLQPSSFLFPHRLNRVRCVLSAADETNTARLAGGGEVWFRFRYAKFLGGVAEGGGLGNSDLMAVCAQQSWQDTTSLSMANFVTHEMGHKLGLVPTGDAHGLCDLDGHPTTYVGKGHTGPHCHAGLPVRDDYAAIGGGTCVMYGSPVATLDFCANCSKALRKVNLSGGWTASWA